ncbi:hypothetical protein TSAR_003336 [Trichomalopsis sarcophagae]|uniref:Uncharacterized protein n=1 Tax=Trichomalopsis sarcophagae TaxID=543379 RepID=A0A232EK99_9HYME|nr:hypothetical protein TSAR_003336 [Trichomalopsis sarcophagae]
MKLFFVTLCVLFAAVYGATKSDSKSEKIFHECLEENDIKESDFKNLEGKKDPKMRCLMACILEKEGALKDGEIDGDVIKKDIIDEFTEVDAQKISDAVDTCVDGANDLSDICEKTSFIIECLKVELDKLEMNMN